MPLFSYPNPLIEIQFLFSNFDPDRECYFSKSKSIYMLDVMNDSCRMFCGWIERGKYGPHKAFFIRIFYADDGLLAAGNGI